MSSRHTASLRPGAVIELRVTAAYRDGQATAVERARRVNPWRGQGETAVERVLAVMWARGYTAGNPLALIEARTPARGPLDDITQALPGATRRPGPTRDAPGRARPSLRH